MDNPSLKKGDFFTITEWTRHTDYSYVGNCLEALAVDGDFVRVNNHDCIFISQFTLDLRAFNYKKLKPSFVKSVLDNEVEEKELIASE